ncbi:MAG: hypothetical protein V7703_17600, partial [Hyphomicrobiales bacterium]
ARASEIQTRRLYLLVATGKTACWWPAAQTRRIVAQMERLSAQIIEKDGTKIYQKMILPFATAGHFS